MSSKLMAEMAKYAKRSHYGLVVRCQHRVTLSVLCDCYTTVQNFIQLQGHRQYSIYPIYTWPQPAVCNWISYLDEV